MRRCLLVACLLLAACTANDAGDTTTTGPSTTTTDPTSTHTTTPTTSPAQTTTTVEIISPLPEPTGAVIATGEGWELTDDEFADLVDFAARAMQQSFPDPVAVEVLGTNGVTESSPDGFEYLSPAQWDVLRGLGLVPADADLSRVNGIRHQRVRGTCCPTVGGVISARVEDTGFEVLTSYVIVHELGHALFTQVPPAGVLPDTIFDEPVDLVTAAAEGVPQYGAVLYHEALSEVDKEAIALELPIIRDQDLEAEVPPAAAELLTFGYSRGSALVRGLAESGVGRPYDAVMDRFPGTSEQVLFTDAYAAGEEPVQVAPPALPPGVGPSTQGRLGALFLMLMAKTVVTEEEALALVRPWAGDTYVAWADGDRACIAANVSMDDAPSAEAFFAVLEDWASAAPAATVSSEGTSIVINSCSA